MDTFRYCMSCIVLISALSIVVQAGSKHRSESYSCRLLNTKYIDSQPWLEYPVVFEPVVRGRLSIWSGISGLPGSEFKCYAGKEGSNMILLEFANFSDKLEWTYFDANKGITHSGVSVSHRENVVYKIHLTNDQNFHSFKCNKIAKIELTSNADETIVDIRSTCQNCDSSIISLVNGQISEYMNTKLNEQVTDGLYWHLTQLISSQHFTGPIPLSGDFN